MMNSEGKQAGQTAAHPYRSPRNRANWTIGLLVAACILFALWMLIDLVLLRMLSLRDTGQPFPSAELSGALDARNLVVLLAVVVIPTSALFLMWIHLTSRNLQPLGTHGQRFSPGWAVGWWFVPIMNFFRPYQALAEIWRSTGEWPVALVIWWWVSWLAANFVGITSLVYERRNLFVPDAIPSDGYLWLDIIANTLLVCAGVLAILIVRRITSRQDEIHHRTPTG